MAAPSVRSVGASKTTPGGSAVLAAVLLLVAWPGASAQGTDGCAFVYAGVSDVSCAVGAGDGSPATDTSVCIANPTGLAMNAAGDMLIDEFSRIRLIAANRTVWTLAGGGTQNADGVAATNYNFDRPIGGVAWDDATGDVFVTERTRVLRIRGGVVTWIAGNGSTMAGPQTGPALNTSLLPGALALHPGGGVVIVDAGTRVRRIVNGSITTIAGNMTATITTVPAPATWYRVQTAAGVAVDSRGRVYIVEAPALGWVRRVETNGTIVAFIGVGSGNNNVPALQLRQFNHPVGISVDADDLVLVAEQGMKRVWSVDADGIIRTIAGVGGGASWPGNGHLATGGLVRLNEPMFALRRHNRTYIANMNANTVVMVVPESECVVALVAVRAVFAQQALVVSVTVNVPAAVTRVWSAATRQNCTNLLQISNTTLQARCSVMTGRDAWNAIVVDTSQRNHRVPRCTAGSDVCGLTSAFRRAAVLRQRTCFLHYLPKKTPCGHRGASHRNIS